MHVAISWYGNKFHEISDFRINVQDKDKKVALVIVSIFPPKFMHCVCGFNKVWFSEAFVRLLL